MFGDRLALEAPPKSQQPPTPQASASLEWIDISRFVAIASIDEPCPAVRVGGDCQPALDWLTSVAIELGWLKVESPRGSPGKWRYTITPGTELEARAKGRTWQQLLDTLIRPSQFEAIASNFQQKLQQQEESICF